MKTCCTCKTEKPLDSSYYCNNKSTKDGFSDQCKECAKKYRDEHKVQKSSYPSSAKEYRDQYIDENREHVNDVRRKNYQQNKDKYKKANHDKYLRHRKAYRASQRIYYLDNTAEIAEKNKRFRDSNRLYIYLKNRARQKMLKVNSITQKQINNLLMSFNNECYYCGISVKIGVNLHLDHKIPLSRKYL